MADSSSGTKSKRPLPAFVTALSDAAEPLWTASLAALFVVWGYDLIPRAIHMLGRGGQTETIEWAVYMSLLAGFPVATALIGLVVPRVFGKYAQTIIKASLVLFAVWIALLFAIDGRIVPALIALVPAVATALLEIKFKDDAARAPHTPVAGVAILVLVGVAAWMCAGGLVSWTRGSDWFTSNFWRTAALAIATGLSLWGLPIFGARPSLAVKASMLERVAHLVILFGLIAFGFRTNPVVEFYHWGFWTGPIEQMRQGGWLLFDTPSQYGFLTILIPTLFPASAWLSFWFFQAVIYGIVAWMMFSMFRRMRSGIPNLLFASLLVFTTLFYRPRTASLILPSQMTPSGGPVRFLWCFVLLAWLLRVYERRTRDKVAITELSFPRTGHLIWLCSIAWSFEAAIYCSAIWFAAFAIHLIQQSVAEREKGMRRRSIAGRIVKSIAVPIAMAIALYVVLWLIYSVAYGIRPDLAGYIEFGFLYTKGYGSLPVNTSGAVWYLLLVFFVVSTAGAALLVENWRDFRLVVAAGVWGGVWSLSSYFVSRSHPVNLLSIAPVLLFALAVLFIVIRDTPPGAWQSSFRVATIPLFAVPIALTLGHPSLLTDLQTRQLSFARFTDQIPLMDAELESLLRIAGAKPWEPMVRIGDGRLLLPPWRGENGAHVMSVRSWLPKPYEIISTLPRERRMTYIERDAAKPIAGWLINHQSDTLKEFDINEILKTHRADKKVNAGPWSVWWMVPR